MIGTLHDRSICHERFKLFKHNLLASLHFNFGRSQDQSKAELPLGAGGSLTL